MSNWFTNLFSGKNKSDNSGSSQDDDDSTQDNPSNKPAGGFMGGAMALFALPLLLIGLFIPGFGNKIGSFVSSIFGSGIGDIIGSLGSGISSIGQSFAKGSGMTQKFQHAWDETSHVTNRTLSQVQGNKAAYMVNYLTDQNVMGQDVLTKDEALCMVANMKTESGFNPRVVGDGGVAYGIMQWHPDRHILQSLLDIQYKIPRLKNNYDLLRMK